MTHTSSFDLLVDLVFLHALVDIGVLLDGERPASFGLTTHVRASVHSTLKRVAIPAEDVVSMLAIPGASVGIQ